jgi:hypothetical protein
MTGVAVSNETEVQSKLNSIVSCADGIVLAVAFRMLTV